MKDKQGYANPMTDIEVYPIGLSEDNLCCPLISGEVWEELGEEIETLSLKDDLSYHFSIADEIFKP
jgi:hypothetical protein